MVSTRGLEYWENAQAMLANGGMSARDRHVVPMSGEEEVRARVIFWLGRPGSGKSTLMEATRKHFEERGYTVVTLDDYAFLYLWAYIQTRLDGAAADTAPIYLTKNGERSSVVVNDLTLLEQVLPVINNCIMPHLSQQDTIIMVEFARASYLVERVWQHFHPDVLMSARYIFCNAVLDVCIERVEQRQGHIVPGEIMSGYYRDDGLLSLYQSCHGDRIEVVSTNDTVCAAKQRVLGFCNRIIAEPVFKAEGAVSPEIARGWYRKSNFVNLLESYQRSVRG